MAALSAAIIVVGIILAFTSASADPDPILGDSAVEATPDSSALGVVEANQYVASSTGTVSSLAIYVDAANAATGIALGIYSDTGCVPGSLLAQGSATEVRNAAWNFVTVPSIGLDVGRPYWIARLALSGGSLVTRVNPSVANPDRGDARRNPVLPATFDPAGSWPHLTSMYAVSARAAGGFVGDNTVEGTPDSSSVGTVEANQFTATTSGSVNSISIFLDASNQATSIALGIYSDASGVPGTLLTQGSRSGLTSGAWNSASTPAITLTAGVSYWIAHLAQAGGNLVTRINSASPNPDRVDTRASATLPASFSPGASFPHRTSIFAGTASGATAPPATPSPTPAPTPTAPTSGRTCTEVIGFSETYQWYFGGYPTYDQFYSQLPPGSVQLRWDAGASIDKWADPSFSGWTGGLGSRACTAGSDDPDAVILTITSSDYVTDIAWWRQQISAAIGVARARYANLRTVFLQPVVGGPSHESCFVGGVQVRATYNEPYIEQAIGTLLGNGVSAGADPLVRTCADYADDIGHLTDGADGGRGAAATSIGVFYASH